MKSCRTTLAILSFAALVACGGGNTSKSSSTGGVVTPPSTGGTGGSTSSGGGPATVAVAAGTATSGTDIGVASGTPPLNAQVLGVSALNSGGGSASNTGGVIQRGTQANVLLFGKGLNGSLKISVLGPTDISISNPQTIKSTTGLSGVQFTVAVNTDATPGARTVLLEDAQGNITTFTGGLEIQ